MIHYLKTVLDEIYEGVSICDRNSKVLFFNKAYEKIENLSRTKIIGRTEQELWGTNFGQKVMFQGQKIKNERLVYKTLSGKEISILRSVIPYYENEELKGMFSIARNITTIDKFISSSYALQKEVAMSERLSLGNGSRYTLDNIIGESLQIKECKEQAKKASRFNTNILISGETGTGKELFAQGIHNQSQNSQEPFVGINCAAIPDTLLESLLFGTEKGAFTGAVASVGLFEQAGKGTLFLDEIDSMPFSMQAKLLRALAENKFRRIGGDKEKEIKCRIISAINSDVFAKIANGKMRQDLYYRIAAFVLHVPPLRERKGDIVRLVTYFIKKYTEKLGSDVTNVEQSALEAMLQYDWPGNVRELEHVIESAIIIADNESNEIHLGHLPAHISMVKEQERELPQEITGSLNLEENLDFHKLVRQYEETLIRKALAFSSGNISAAAKKLKIHRNVLYQKMKKLNLNYSPNL